MLALQGQPRRRHPTSQHLVPWVRATRLRQICAETPRRNPSLRPPRRHAAKAANAAKQTTAAGAFALRALQPADSRPFFVVYLIGNAPEPHRNHAGTTPEPHWNHAGTTLEPRRNHAGTTPEPHWNHTGTTLEPHWNRLGGCCTKCAWLGWTKHAATTTGLRRRSTQVPSGALLACVISVWVNHTRVLPPELITTQLLSTQRTQTSSSLHYEIENGWPPGGCPKDFYVQRMTHFYVFGKL